MVMLMEMCSVLKGIMMSLRVEELGVIVEVGVHGLQSGCGVIKWYMYVVSSVYCCGG